MHVERFAVYRCVVNLEVAGMNDHADRRPYCQRHAINRAVGHVQIFNRKRAEHRGVARFHFVQRGFFQQAMFFQLFLDDGQRKFRAVNRHIQFGKNVGNRADVIFVRVGQHDGPHFIFVLLQVADVRDDDVHAQQFLLGEHQSRVNHDDVLSATEGHHVHAKFAQTA